MTKLGVPKTKHMTLTRKRIVLYNKTIEATIDRRIGGLDKLQRNFPNRRILTFQQKSFNGKQTFFIVSLMLL